MTNLDIESFSSEIVLPDENKFRYFTKPYEFKNVLGHTVATFKEYCVTNSDSQISFRLYKTKDGNWYDVTELKTPHEKNLIRTLKSAIDAIECKAEVSNQVPDFYQVSQVDRLNLSGNLH